VIHWLIAVGAGVVLSILFYALVRIRIAVAPRIRSRFGDRARWATWVFTIGLMVLAANAGLIILRQVLHEQYGVDAPFMHEMVYALLAFAIGFVLVNRHVTRNRD